MVNTLLILMLISLTLLMIINNCIDRVNSKMVSIIAVIITPLLIYYATGVIKETGDTLLALLVVLQFLAWVLLVMRLFLLEAIRSMR